MYTFIRHRAMEAQGILFIIIYILRVWGMELAGGRLAIRRPTTKLISFVMPLPLTTGPVSRIGLAGLK